MHETALANSIVQSVLRHAENAKAGTIRSVTIGLGEWSTFQREQVRFWVKVGFQSTSSHGALVRFRKIRGKIHCRTCGRTGACVSSGHGIDRFIGPVLRCPKCDSPDVEIVQGREAIILKITVEERSETKLR